MSDLGEELFLRLAEIDRHSEECVHVTDLLRDLYKGKPVESVFTRGKLYHLAIENLIMVLKIEKKLDVIELEEPHDLYYTVKNRRVRLCFTPDAIVNRYNKTTLVEIKSSAKSRDYALIQTSIYRYLLETFMKQKIDECEMVTGDLLSYKLPCSSEIGKKELDTRLARSLFIYY